MKNVKLTSPLHSAADVFNEHLCCLLVSCGLEKLWNENVRDYASSDVLNMGQKGHGKDIYVIDDMQGAWSKQIISSFW